MLTTGMQQVNRIKNRVWGGGGGGSVLHKNIQHNKGLNKKRSEIIYK